MYTTLLHSLQQICRPYVYTPHFAAYNSYSNIKKSVFEDPRLTWKSTVCSINLQTAAAEQWTFQSKATNNWIAGPDPGHYIPQHNVSHQPMTIPFLTKISTESLDLCFRSNSKSKLQNDKTRKTRTNKMCTFASLTADWSNEHGISPLAKLWGMWLLFRFCTCSPTSTN
jgi:hypothetical protein